MSVNAPSVVDRGGPVGEQLHRISDQLTVLLSRLNAPADEIAIGDGARRELVLDNFPTAGRRRIIAYRTGFGYDSFPAVTAPGTLLLPNNEGRIGSSWVNSGTNPVIIYLARQAGPGVPAVWLAPTGGSWDGMFGRRTWTGHLWAVAQTGTSTLVGGEF